MLTVDHAKDQGKGPTPECYAGSTPTISLNRPKPM
jgi:hypothetical protein